LTRTQYFTATSLDGYIADDHNSLDWLFEVDREHGEDSFAQFFGGVGAMAMGATTYEWVLAHERLLDEPDNWGAYYGATPCWVFTHRTLPPVPGANLRFVEGDVGLAPVTLGAGAPLLPRRLTSRDLELADVVRDRQFVRLTYRVSRPRSGDR